MWRYREALPVGPADAVVETLSMGEGMTSLIPQPNGNVDIDVRLKVDFLMPTSSYKDRGAAMLVAHAIRVGARQLIADSSGNAGTAISAYAGRAGLPCTVFVRADSSAKKLAQMRSHGATVVEVPGTREDAAAAAMAAVESTHSFYASHVFNPFFIEGTKTFGYEVWEQLGWAAPEAIVVPVGNGTLVLGAARAFEELLASGEIGHLPRLIAVQAAGCAPIARGFEAGTPVVAVANEGTIADGIAIAVPARGDQIIEAVRRSGGAFVTVDDDETRAAMDNLARQGLFVEPTAATPWAALLRLCEDSSWRPLGPVVLPLTGSGLKAA